MRKNKKLFTKIAAVFLSAAMAFSPAAGTISPVYAAETIGTRPANEDVSNDARIYINGTLNISGCDDYSSGNTRKFYIDLKDESGNVVATDQVLVRNSTVTYRLVFAMADCYMNEENSALLPSKPGTYNYTIVQRKGDVAGIDYDTTEHPFTVSVSDEGTYSYVARVSGDGITSTITDLSLGAVPGQAAIPLNVDTNVTAPTITNTYKAAPVKVQFSGTNTVKGIDDSTEPFTFTLSEDEKVLQTVVKKGAGDIAFDPISYSEEGDHTYVVAESKGSTRGYQYDNKTYTLIVNVNDYGRTGQLTANISGDSYSGTNINFTNTYKADPVKITFSGHNYVTKKDGSTYKDYHRYTVKMEDADGRILRTESVTDDSDYSLSPFTYNATGTYKYKVYITADSSDSDYTVDSKVYNFTVDVKDNKEGSCTATLSGDTVTGTDLDFHTIYDRKTVDVAGKIAWDDDNNRDGLRPREVELSLIANGKTIKKETFSTTNVSCNFPDVAKYDENGNEIKYTIQETAIDGYEATYSANADNNVFTITNKHTPATKHISGKITWDDDNNRDGLRPKETTLTLVTENTHDEDKTITVNSHDDTYDFGEVPVYDNNHRGNPIDYRVVEKDIDGYTISGKDKVDEVDPDDIEKEAKQTISYTGTDITNKHTPATIQVLTRTKFFDEKDRDGIRPEEVTVTLLADGKEVRSFTDSVKGSDGTNQHDYGNLPVYNNGKKIEYSAVYNNNVVPDGYTFEYGKSQYGDLAFDGTYTHKIATQKIGGEIIWDDDNNRDGLRPATNRDLHILLLANGKEVGTCFCADHKTLKFINRDYNGEYPVYSKGKKINYTLSLEETLDGYTTTYDGFNIINKHVPATVKYFGKVVWDDDNNREGLRPKEVTVQLKTRSGVVKEVTIPVGNEKETAFDFGTLPKNDGGHSAGYDGIGLKDTIEGYTGYPHIALENEDTILTYTHEVKKNHVSGRITWDDKLDADGLRPDEAELTLLADGEKVKTIKTSDSLYDFGLQPVYANGKKVTYTVQETSIDGYDITYDGFDITNTHSPATIDIKGNINWDDKDNKDGLRPESVTLQLTADGERVGGPVTVTAKDNWAYEWPDVQLNKFGKKRVFKVTQSNVEKYQTTSSTDNAGDVFTFTNIYAAPAPTEPPKPTETPKPEPEKINVSGKIAWDDNDNADGLRPDEVTLTISADGKEVKTITVPAENNDTWGYSFDGMPKTTDDGTEIKYTVDEKAVDGYTTTTNDFDITNSHVQGKVSVTGKIAWDDNDNADGLRPEKVTLTLIADGKEVKTIETDGKNYSFGDMPLKKDGKEIEYKIVEKAIDGYETTYDGYDITNKHTPDTKHISGKITWDDDNNRDGKRPEEVEITLIKDGKEVKTITVSSDGTFDFGDVPMNEDGKEIKYEIKEKDIDGYDITYTDNDVVNKHEAEKADIKVSVSWDDKDDEDKARPDKVVIQLMDGDKKIGDPVTVTTKDGWTYTFKDMYANEKGKAISYSVTEDAVDKYTTVINKKDDGFAIVNTHKVIEKSDISGNITWIDNNNKDNTRPDDVVIILTRDGKEIGRKTVFSSDDWKYDFGKQPKTDENGNAYTYELKEEDVNGYDISVKGYDVTNTLKKTDDNKVTEKVNPSGTITWNDNDNKGKTRPDKVTIILYANGNEINRKEITAQDNWKYDFGQLDKLDKNGKEISYTIKEADVNGYDISIKGFDVTNTLKKSDDASKSDDKNDNTTDGKSTGDVVTAVPVAVAAVAAGVMVGVLVAGKKKKKEEDGEASDTDKEKK